MVVVELADCADLPAILALQKLAYHSEAELYNDYHIPPLRQSLAELTEEAKGVTILKAVSAGQLVGSVRARIQDRTCFIGRLMVHPDFQNRGIGKQLLHAIEQRYPAYRLELFTGSRSEKNLIFYQKLGYRPFKTAIVNPGLILIYLEKY